MPYKDKEKHRKNSRDYYRNHSEEGKQYRKDWYQRNKARQKEKRLLFKYGIDQAAYDLMNEKQDSRCLLCGRHASDDRDGVLHVDHDHRTRKVRGLLCSQCNVGLGLFQDNADLLLRAANYLLDRRL